MAKRNAESEKKGRQHNNRLNRYSKQIDALYEELCAEASRLGVLADYEDDIDKIFSFDDYPAIRRRADELFNSFARKMEYTVNSGIESEWKASVAKNTAMVKQLLAGTTLSSVITDKFLPRNLEAVHAFQKRKVQGMGLSERVWNITQQARREMELAMDVALSDGRSAATLSRDIRHLLREPNKLFRRVRDKHGNLQLSKAAQAYHPGQGVYRSSARNAQRLARTEINMAYHEADSQYWSSSDIVLGIEIVLSNNHPIVDICDEFEGKQFPKWFKFTGWHPNCRCVAVPITPKREEMVDYLKRMARGEDVSNYQFSGVVNDLPNEFKQWMTDNADRLEGMYQRGKLPYFVKENGLYGEEGVARSATERHRNIEEIERGVYLEGHGIDVSNIDINMPMTQEQIRNAEKACSMLDVERESPMDFEHANGSNCNPYYNPREFSNSLNCCYASTVFEMRARGINVIAQEWTVDGFEEKVLGKHKNRGLMYIDPITRNTPKPFEAKCFPHNAYEILSQNAQAKGRYQISTNKHRLCAVNNGSDIFIYDAQKAKVFKLKDWLNSVDFTEIAILRTDNLLFNLEHITKVATRR